MKMKQAEILHVVLAVAIGTAWMSTVAHAGVPDQYGRTVLDDNPVAYWRFDGINRGDVENTAGDSQAGKAIRQAALERVLVRLVT